MNEPKPASEKHRVPHGFLYYKNADVTSPSALDPAMMVVYCGEQVAFKIEGITSESQVFSNFLAFYYCFDVKYPAMYSILQIVDMFCLSPIDPALDCEAAPPKKKRNSNAPGGKGKKPSALKLSNKLGKFIEDFKTFVAAKTPAAIDLVGNGNALGTVDVGAEAVVPSPVLPSPDESSDDAEEVAPTEKVNE